ncbi:hypothetical protein B296_00031778 [Ensete ventricosum]|uniref:Uncharacterized protein n=1 Tax=Ensete ventricosum TaxID=4639 RepID=A0A426XVL9_ENSVE|nr:hypothetical protein B296_00031778 [Ensete ventricosum]
MQMRRTQASVTALAEPVAHTLRSYVGRSELGGTRLVRRDAESTSGGGSMARIDGICCTPPGPTHPTAGAKRLCPRRALPIPPIKSMFLNDTEQRIRDGE